MDLLVLLVEAEATMVVVLQVILDLVAALVTSEILIYLINQCTVITALNHLMNQQRLLKLHVLKKHQQKTVQKKAMDMLK